MAGSDSTLHIRLPKRLRAALQRAADQDGRTLSAYSILVLSGKIPSPIKQSWRR